MTKFGMKPRQRDIVLIPVPFTDLSATKRRPVLVLSKTSHNRRSPDVLVAAITSNMATKGIGVRLTRDDMEEGLLPRESRVCIDKIYTLSTAIIIKRYGRLSEDAFAAVLCSLDEVLGR